MTLPESLASSADPREDGAPPQGPSHPTSQADALSVPSISGTRPEGNIDTVESPQRRSIFKRWLQQTGNKDPASHKPDCRSGKSREPADHRPPSYSAVRPDITNEGPSRMAVSAFP